jgi:hypothetical protein
MTGARPKVDLADSADGRGASREGERSNARAGDGVTDRPIAQGSLPSLNGNPKTGWPTEALGGRDQLSTSGSLACSSGSSRSGVRSACR